ncbi:helix-turn-helix domain-containing protein [Novosphingobium pentaromativorans]|uniref:HTH cro/C1-type domain-containing protein n=1 Tax=Novosphingobium pentaromativorans US6-1 TaxID=1088721 RepID=G6ED20_9SPHN|nr:helix-turn-helix domain-containing protein [Novosphingobium pentaromativorans]AIT79876.1 hypothetical protein JI59_08880 [Novosphingobium pentaromativorans US6-1]EHJ60859.1 hypothetical protein NSU_2241 [Novosphingobium pentaromativorans US6-1]
MEDVESNGAAVSPTSAGSRLRQAREAAGLTRADIATQTKIAERHLIAIEEDRFNDLAARTYAVGFSRAYARALGIDEVEIADQVREQLHAGDHLRSELVEPSFEPGDPARVPPVRMAWIAAAGVVVVVGLLLAFWGSFLSPEGKLPDLIADKPAATASKAPAQGPAAVPSQAAANTGPVVMTATADRVWVKVTDADGKQLLQKELALGESWTVPQDAAGPELRTARPDALQLTVGGQAVPEISDKPTLVSGVSLAAADVLARGTGRAASPATQAVPAPAPAQTPRTIAVPTRDPAPSAQADRSGPLPTPSPTPVAASRASAPAPLASPRPAAPRPAPTASAPVRAKPSVAAATAAPSGAASAKPAPQAKPTDTAAPLPTPSPTPSPRPSDPVVSTVSE